jgi:hypothetical protein
MRTMCSPTHNAASITTGYPPANRPPSEPATQMPQAAFSACSPACSPTAPRATADRLVPDQSNRTRDPMQIKSLATYLKTCVIFFPLQYLHFSPSNVCATQRRLTPLFSFFLSLLYCIASTARGRAAFPVVGLVRRGMRCRFRVHHRQRARPRRWYICGQSTWGHSRRKGQERGRRILRVGRATESRGTWNTFLSLTGRARALFFNLTNCTTCLQILRVLALKVLGVAYT